MVRSILLVLGIGMLCTLLAGWLRMAYPRMTWEYAPAVLQQPLATWPKALWVTGLSELLFFYWMYIPGLLLYALLMRHLFPQQYTFGWAVAVGGLLGAAWYGVVGILGNFLWQEGRIVFLGPLYTGIGALVGALYYRWGRRAPKA